MRYLAVPVDMVVEIHGPFCPEAGAGEVINAVNAFGAAVEYWRRRKLRGMEAESRALMDSYLFPCGKDAGKPVRTAPRGKLPFAPDASDGEILTALMGKRIHWTNGQTGREEEGRLYPDFSPYVAKYADNGRAHGRNELANYFTEYRRRDPVGFLRSRLETHAIRPLQTQAAELLRGVLKPNSPAFRMAKNAFWKAKSALF